MPSNPAQALIRNHHKAATPHRGGGLFSSGERPIRGARASRPHKARGERPSGEESNHEGSEGVPPSSSTPAQPHPSHEKAANLRVPPQDAQPPSNVSSLLHQPRHPLRTDSDARNPKTGNRSQACSRVVERSDTHGTDAPARTTDREPVEARHSHPVLGPIFLSAGIGWRGV